MAINGESGAGQAAELLVSAWDGLPLDVRQYWDQLMTTVSLPPLLTELADVNFDVEHFDPARLADVASADPVLAGKLLAVANSAAFGLIQPVNSVRRAVVHLGLNLVRSIVIAYQLELVFGRAPHFPRAHLEYLRTWAVGTAVLSQHTLEEVRFADPHVVATAGLLSRIGCLVLGLGELKPTAAYRQLPSEAARLQYELDNWGVGSPVLGGRLLSSWAIPAPLSLWVARSWEPLALELPAGEENRAITVIAAGGALVAQYLATREGPVIETVEHEHYGVLRDNLLRHELLAPLTAVLGKQAMRRELSGTCLSGGEGQAEQEM